jgi:hypothetical protein
MILWLPVDGEEREVREVIQDLEKGLLRHGLEHVLSHAAVDESATSERADAVRHSLRELMNIEKLRFSDVQVSVRDGNALVRLTVNGYAADPNGHWNPYARPTLFRFEKQVGEWKITEIFPWSDPH